MNAENDLDLDWYYATKPSTAKMLYSDWPETKLEKCKTCGRPLLNPVCGWCMDQEEGDE